MAFKREKVNDYFLLDTRVENVFINEYMAVAPGDFIKVYLFAQMYADLAIELTNEEISRSLNMELEDVLRAWTYWEKKGVINKIYDDDKDKLKYDVEFVSLKAQLYGAKTNKKVADQTIKASMGDKKIQEMLEAIEKAKGNMLSGTELQEIVQWVNDYKVDPDVIVYAYKYGVKKRKTNLKYIEAIIRNWSDEGLYDVESVEKKLSETDRRHYQYNRVFKALGFSRKPTEEEQRIMNTWFDEMEFSLDKVVEACGKTTGISEPNIKYVNAILVNEHEAKNGVAANGKRKDVTVAEVNKYYDLLRAQEEKAAAGRRQEVFSKVPEIKAIEDELNALAAEVSKIIISDRKDKKTAMDKIKEKTNSLNYEEAFLLTDNGFEITYMDVKYHCDKCKDTGIRETGERCQCFGEVTREKIDLMLKQVQ